MNSVVLVGYQKHTALTPSDAPSDCKEIAPENLIKTFQENEGVGFYSITELDPSFKTVDTTRGSRLSYKGYSGPTKWTLGTIVFDFDSADPELALLDARAFVEALFPHDQYQAYFSGSKGFHIVVSEKSFGQSVTRKQVQNLVEFIKEERFPTIDSTVYSVHKWMRMPGSKHDSTGLYKIPLSPEQLFTLEISDIKKLAESLPADLGHMPPRGVVSESLALMLDALPEPEEYQKDSSELVDKIKAVKNKPCTQKIELDSYSVGDRNEALRALIEDWFYTGVLQSEAEKRGMAFYAKNGISGSRMREVERMVSNFYSGKNRYTTGCYSKIKKSRCSGKCEIYKLLNPAKRAEVSDVDEKEVKKNLVAKEVVKKVKVSKKVEKYFDEHPTIYNTDSKVTYLYNGMFYERVSDEWMKALCDKLAGYTLTTKQTQEIFDKIRRKNSQKQEFFEQSVSDHINMINGWFNKKTGMLEPRTADRPFLYCLGFSYDRHATSPKWDAALESIFSGDKERITYLEEFYGYALSDDRQWYQKCLIQNGEGSNGKSVLMNVLRKMAGDGNYSSYRIDLFKKDHNAVADLYGKLFNISTEVSDYALSDTAYFKQLTGDDPISGRFIYKSYITFTARAKQILAVNKLPVSRDQEHALYRRFGILNFDRTFSPTDPDYDPNFSEKLEGELSGIFNRVYTAYRRAADRGSFSEPKNLIDAVQELKEESDLLGDVISHLFEVGTEKDEIRNIDIRFMVAEAFKKCGVMTPPPQPIITKKMKKMFPDSSTFKRSGKFRGITGVKRRIENDAVFSNSGMPM